MRLRLQTPIASDVHDLGTGGLQHSPDEHTPVTLRRVLFPTEQGDAPRPRGIEHRLDPFLEARCFGQPIVQDVLVVIVELLARRPTAQHVADEEILDPVFAQRPLDRLLVEVRRMARVRAGAHVGDGLDPMLAQQPEQRLDRVVRVPDGEDPEGYLGRLVGHESGSPTRPRLVPPAGIALPQAILADSARRH